MVLAQKRDEGIPLNTRPAGSKKGRARLRIAQQAAMAMFSQANALPKDVLQLLQLGSDRKREGKK